jgi:hypothetical protein
MCHAVRVATGGENGQQKKVGGPAAFAGDEASNTEEKEEPKEKCPSWNMLQSPLPSWLCNSVEPVATPPDGVVVAASPE